MLYSSDKMQKLVDNVVQELQELKNVGISVPDDCFNEDKIRNFFADSVDKGSKELSEEINLYILIN